MALESVNYAEDRAVQILQIVKEEEDRQLQKMAKQSMSTKLEKHQDECKNNDATSDHNTRYELITSQLITKLILSRVVTFHHIPFFPKSKVIFLIYLLLRSFLIFCFLFYFANTLKKIHFLNTRIALFPTCNFNTKKKPNSKPITSILKTSEANLRKGIKINEIPEIIDDQLDTTNSITDAIIISSVCSSLKLSASTMATKSILDRYRTNNKICANDFIRGSYPVATLIWDKLSVHVRNKSNTLKYAFSTFLVSF